MRDRLVCPKCGHNHILIMAGMPDVGEGVDPAPLMVAFVEVKKKWTMQTRGRAGHLQAAVCRRCGFTELYTYNPEEIPVDGKYVFEAVGPEPGGGYR